MSKWISVKEFLPAGKYVDELVLICVKNKNKEDGIYLPDIGSFDGQKWSNRVYTWEEITHWMPYPGFPK